MSPTRRLIALAALICAFLMLPACGGRPQLITVGSKDSTEQLVLGEILAQFLEKRFGDENVARRFALSTTQQAHLAVVAGEIDLYPEYSGAALASIRHTQTTGTPDAVRDQLQELFRNRFRCEWIGPLGFENPSVMVVSAETAQRDQIATLTQAEAVQTGWSIASSKDLQQRPDGLPLLMRHYRLHLTAALEPMDPATLYASLLKGRVNMIAASANDPQLDNSALRILADEKAVFPPLEAGIVVRGDTLERIPGLAAALRSLQGRISREKMKEMNKQVDFGKLAPQVVAAAFVREAKL